MRIQVFIEQLKSLTGKSLFKPHKYILLLTVLELIQAMEITDNKIYFDDRLKKTFAKYFKLYSHKSDRNRPHTPFFHLQSSGFWYLKVKQGREDFFASLSSIGAPKDITDNVDYAYLSEHVYSLLVNRESSKRIKNEIIDILLQRGRPLLLNLLEEGSVYAVEETNQSLFQHEEKAIKDIANLIKPIGMMLSNVYLYDNQSNNYYEYDMILVARTGIFVVELKHWSGQIQIAQYNWVVNGTQYRTDPHKKNIFKCKILKGIYEHNFRTYPDIWVESVVVLTNPESIIEGASNPRNAVEQHIHNPTFASITDFITYLKKKETANHGHILDDRQIQAIIEHLNNLNNPRPSVKYNVAGYETIEYISQKPECVELIARPLDGRARGLNRFRIFRIPHQASVEEKKRFLKKAYNTLDAVSQIGDHPHIHKVWVIRNEDGDIIEGSEWSEIGTLQNFIQEQKKEISTQTVAGICYGIVQALSKAHEVNVIHRALKPQNILMMNDIPKLINFDLAYQIEDNRLTVIADVSKLKDDAYIAPEILMGQDIDEGTDYFSLGVIAYELFTGEKPFVSTREFVGQGGALNQQAMQKLMDSGASVNVIEAIKGMVLADRQFRLKDDNKIISAFRSETEDGAVHTEINALLPPGSRYDVYEILELIDKGRSAQIYFARTIRQKQVVLKLFNKEIPRDKIFREAEITSAVQSAYVVHCDNKIGHWNNDRFFLVLEYLDGETMRKMIDRKEKPEPEIFRTIALSLMDAVEAFHDYRDEEGNLKPFLHSDIKPENILITKDQKPVLIDCGAAGEPRIDVFEGTPAYVPPDSIIGTDMKFSIDGDLFALGITLWEWLFGEKPYDNPIIGEVPDISKDLSTYSMENLVAWLVKAVATTASERFASVQEMRQAFISKELENERFAIQQEIVPDPKPEIPQEKDRTEQKGAFIEPLGLAVDNPFVPYLNTLSNASASNENATAESQIGHPFFSRIAVDNPLVNFIYQKLAGEQCNIILTGNAGDGKTTIAADIFTAFKCAACRHLNKIEELGNIVIIKDMSELTETERVKVLKEAVENKSNNYLIVSNTGTLLKSFQSLNINGQTVDQSELLLALEADAPQGVFNEEFLVLNIGRLDSIDTAVNVFKRMLEQENWDKCSECFYYNDCPIITNVKLLQDSKEIVCNRIILLYRRLYEYNIRLTLRQMTGHLAYAITAGHDCNGIANMSHLARQDIIIGSLFFNRFFGDNGRDVHTEATQLQTIHRIRQAQFGIDLNPLFERMAWSGEGYTHFLRGDSLTILQKLNVKYENNNYDYRRQVRRLVYFFRSGNNNDVDEYIQVFLHSPMLLKFVESTSGPNKIQVLQESKYRARVLQVLQEYFTGIRLPEGAWQVSDLYITLNRRLIGSGAQMVLANFRTEDFELTFKPRYEVLGSSRGILSLRYKQSDIEMELDLPFLDYVERRYAGEVAEELSAYYANRLEQFKVKLLNFFFNYEQNNNQNLRLLRLESNRTFKVMQVIVSENSLEVLL